MNTDFLKSKDDLIYELIFTEQVEFKIDVSKFIDDIYQYDEFITDIKSILKKSKVKIIKSEIRDNNKRSKICWFPKVISSKMHPKVAPNQNKNTVVF